MSRLERMRKYETGYWDRKIKRKGNSQKEEQTGQEGKEGENPLEQLVLTGRPDLPAHLAPPRMTGSKGLP